jgi:hypothetical protein
MLAEDSLDHWVNIIETLLPLLGIAVAIVVIGLIITIAVLNLLDMRRLLKQEAVFIELTPPAHADKTPEANQRLFSVLHGLEASRTLLDRILRHKTTFSLEVAGTRDKGIRYILRAAENDAPTLEQAIVSHLPDVKFRRVGDYIPDVTKRVRVLEIRQSGHFAYPLQMQGELWQHDPMAYLTGAMTKLSPDELVALQIVVTPTKVREAYTISKRLLHNEELVSRLGKRKLPILGSIFSIINGILFAIIDGIGDVVSGPSKAHRTGNPHAQHQQQVAMKIKPARVLSSIEQKLAESAHHKLNQPLFSVNIRALVVANTKDQEKQRIKGIQDWLALFKVAKYQALKPRLTLLPKLQRQYRLFALKHRLPSIFRGNTNLFSSSEIADLYHFPNLETTKTENLVRSLSKTLPASLALKNNEFDVVLGQNIHHGTVTDIGLTTAERERHMFVVGGTGNGKTTLLKYAIVQDIKNGKGVAVIDPHGDLAQELLEHIPQERINDVIYFNPADLTYPIGMNILEIPQGLTGDQLLEAKDFIAEMVVSIMRKTFSDDGTGGHRIEYVLRNTVLTALTVKDATIFTVYDLLTDKDYRKPIVDKLEQDWLKNFWKHEFGKAGDYQQVKMMSGVTSKIGRYHASVSAERALEQPKSTINFSEVLDGKILICNLSKGSIGEDTSEVLGISVLAQLQLASYRRIKQKRADRRPFYAYVDEFQNFATTSFVEMLSEARKYKLFLIMAEQTTSQQDDDKMVNTILTNAGTIVCFKSNSQADERQMLHLFNNQLEPGAFANLPSYNFYIKLAGNGEPQEPTSGMTVILEEDGDEDIAEAVIAASRKNYAKKYITKKKRAKKDDNDNKGQQDDKKDSEDSDDSDQLMTNAEG